MAAVDKKWSEMSPQELLDKAQELRDQGFGDHAAFALKAAAVQSRENLAWTIEHRLIPALVDALGRRINA